MESNRDGNLQVRLVTTDFQEDSAEIGENEANDELRRPLLEPILSEWMKFWDGEACIFDRPIGRRLSSGAVEQLYAAV